MIRSLATLLLMGSILFAAPLAEAQSADARAKAEAVVDDMRFMQRLFAVAGIEMLSNGELHWYEGTLANIIDEDNQHASLCAVHTFAAMQEAGIAVAAPQIWQEDRGNYDAGSLRDFLVTRAMNGILPASQNDTAYKRLQNDVAHACRSRRFITALNPELRMGSVEMLEQELCYREQVCPPDPEDDD